MCLCVHVCHRRANHVCVCHHAYACGGLCVCRVCVCVCVYPCRANQYREWDTSWRQHTFTRSETQTQQGQGANNKPAGKWSEQQHIQPHVTDSAIRTTTSCPLSSRPQSYVCLHMCTGVHLCANVHKQRCASCHVVLFHVCVFTYIGVCMRALPCRHSSACGRYPKGSVAAPLRTLQCVRGTHSCIEVTLSTRGVPVAQRASEHTGGGCVGYG